MKLLVRRYVTAEQRKRDDFGITEDDVMEIRQDISTLRYELIDILHRNGMNTPHISLQDTQSKYLLQNICALIRFLYEMMTRNINYNILYESRCEFSVKNRRY